MRIDIENSGGGWHQLAKAEGSHGAGRAGIVAALDLDVGLIEEQPIGGAEARVPKGVMLSHKNLTNMVSMLSSVFEMDTGDGVLRAVNISLK